MILLKRSLKVGLFAYYAAIFLISCTVAAPTPIPDLSIAPLPSVTPNDIVVEPTRTLPTATSLPVSTTALPVTSGETFTPLATEALAPLPTLSPVEAKAFVLELTQNNGGCLLPCFWGFTPGQTEWQTAERSLASFAYEISYKVSDGTFSDTPIGASFVAWLYLYFPEISSGAISYAFTVQDEMITMIEAHILTTPSYTISTILNRYEQPAEVWLQTVNAPVEGSGFYLRLFYSRQNFLLAYATESTIQDEIVRGCFSKQEEGPRLVTWASPDELTYLEAFSGVHPPSSVLYDRPLEEATGMSVETFYETFKDSDEPICLETPIDLWPGP